MSNFVLVIDSEKQPLNPIHPGQARRLLKAGIPAVFRRFPFVIILKQSRSVSSILKPLELKIDPGSKTTGMALLQGEKVVFAAELEHRGQAIRAKLDWLHLTPIFIFLVIRQQQNAQYQIEN